MRALTRTRHRLTVACMLAALAAAPLAAASDAALQLLVVPPQPTPTEGVAINFRYLPDGVPPCTNWFESWATADTIVLTGAAAPIGTCALPNGVDLGVLAAGHYRVVARMTGESEPLAEVHFDVAPQPEVPANVIDVALDPPEPRAGEPFSLVLSVMNSTCGGVSFPSAPFVDGDALVLEGEIASCPVIPVEFATYGQRFAAPALPAGLRRIELRTGSQTLYRKYFHVVEPNQKITTWNGRFEATLEWQDRAGSVHDATATRLTTESGQFWFFDADNAEVTLKVLNGVPINGRYWVFAASMTDLAFSIRVRDIACELSQIVSSPATADDATCTLERRYEQQAGRNRNFLDTQAFQECPTCPQFTSAPAGAQAAARP